MRAQQREQMTLLAGVGIKHQGVSWDVKADISVCPELDELDYSSIRIAQTTTSKVFILSIHAHLLLDFFL